MDTPHVDISVVAIEHFLKTGGLHPEVLGFDHGRLEELIDAIPDDRLDLVEMLRKRLELQEL